MILGSIPVTRHRHTVGTTDSSGRYQASTTTSTVRISLQPDGDGEAAMMALSGQNNERSYKAYCARGALRGLVEGDSGTLPDLVVYDGETYEVASNKDYYMVLPHLAVRLVALQTTGEGAAHNTETEDLETVLQGVRTHLKAVSGLGDGRVIVAGQRRPQPSFPFFTVAFPEWEQVSPDENRAITSPRLTVGAVVVGGTLAIEVEHNGGTTAASLVADADTTAATAAQELADQLGANSDLAIQVDGATITVSSILALSVTVSDTTGDISEDSAIASSRGGTRSAALQVRGYGEAAAPVLAALLTALNEAGDGWEIGGAITTEQQPTGRGYLLISTLTVRRTFGIEAASTQDAAEVADNLAGTLTLQSVDGDITQPLNLEF